MENGRVATLVFRARRAALAAAAVLMAAPIDARAAWEFGTALRYDPPVADTYTRPGWSAEAAYLRAIAPEAEFGPSIAYLRWPLDALRGGIRPLRPSGRATASGTASSSDARSGVELAVALRARRNAGVTPMVGFKAGGIRLDDGDQGAFVAASFGVGFPFVKPSRAGILGEFGAGRNVPGWMDVGVILRLP